MAVAVGIGQRFVRWRVFGGSNVYPVKSIDYVTIASTGNAADFGEMLFSVARKDPSAVHGCASATRIVCMEDIGPW